MTSSTGNRVVIAAVSDVFFTAKIEAAAARAGVLLVEAADARQLSNRLATVIPDLIIFDLNCAACEPLEFIDRIRRDGKFQKTHILGFLAHVQKDLERKAKEAGCQKVISRAEFSSDLDRILATDFTDSVAGHP
jgi:CheY-like chemotaxis protein